jgi:predicted DNA-binding transcriptional regulator AlpA
MNKWSKCPSKRLLAVDEAAEYCGMRRQSFMVNCPVKPKRIRPGLRGLRYDVHDLDAWIDTLVVDGEAKAEGQTADQWLARLDGIHQDQGRQGLRQQR